MRFTHVLITRPEPEASQLARRLADSALLPVVMPAFSFQAKDPGMDVNRWLTTAGRSLAIFSSPRAVRFALSAIERGLFEGVEIAAIGPATAAVLAEFNIEVDFLPASSFDSQSLLVLDEINQNPGTAVIFAAPGGRQALVRGLQAAGWDTHFALVYERCPLEVQGDQCAELERSGRVLSIWTSANALQLLSNILSTAAWTKVIEGEFLVISARIGKLATGVGAETVHICDGPGKGALLSAIRELASAE